MRQILFILSTIILTSLAHAETVVYESSTQKKWSDVQVVNTWYFKSKNEVGIMVMLTNSTSPYKTPYPNPTMNYQDSFIVPGLTFDENVGEHGAIVYGQTVCAFQSFMGFKETQNCDIEILDGSETYTVRLVVK